MRIDASLFKAAGDVQTNLTLLTEVQQYMDVVEYLRDSLDADRPWYRGVSHASYALVPRVYRDRLWEVHEDFEWWLSVDFENRARPFIPNHQTYSTWDWYFTMQHYGLPTRLLDWTEGSLIGLYFAVRAPQETHIPSVYFLDPYWFDEVVYQKEPGEGVAYNTDTKAISDELETRLGSYLSSRNEAPPFPVCLQPPVIDARIQAQKSVFTIHGKLIDPFRIVARDNVRARLVKIRLSTSSACHLKDQLHGMGITEGTLFPGLRGLVEDLKWERGVD